MIELDWWERKNRMRHEDMPEEGLCAIQRVDYGSLRATEATCTWMRDLINTNDCHVGLNHMTHHVYTDTSDMEGHDIGPAWFITGCDDTYPVPFEYCPGCGRRLHLRSA